MPARRDAARARSKIHTDSGRRTTTNPAYYGINGLREALLGGGGWSEVAPDVAVLAGFVVVFLPLSVWIFERALAASRRAGILGNY